MHTETHRQSVMRRSYCAAESPVIHSPIDSRGAPMEKAQHREKRDFLLSIHPKYAQLIMNGTKTVELRRRFANQVAEDAIALIYCTSPTQAIIGMTAIVGVECLPLAKLWRNHGNAARVQVDAFRSYFRGCEVGYALLLGEAKRFKKSVSAICLKKQFGFVAPQSFIYLSSKYYPLFGNGQLQIPY
jgi:predicted transcriptional regulator